MKDRNHLNVVEGLTGQEIISSGQIHHRVEWPMILEVSWSSSVLMANKAVCLDTEVRPIKGKCLVYSFGVNYKWSFGDIIDKYGCDTHSTRKRTHSGLSLNKLISYHWISLWITRRRRVYNSFPFFNRLNILRKMETEGDDERDACCLSPICTRRWNNATVTAASSITRKLTLRKDEWAVLLQILESGMTDRVRQLGVEIANQRDQRRWVFTVWLASSDLLRIIYRIIVRFDSKFNPFF